ncbi:hypothetical protein Dform_00255 [Dehalogenimonas formicexedens]|uniref:DUF4386 domain-containing protein n=1 Tax=Dehalogenimonas formicexedens TaxID=1839801 RepID=A0A1P8F5B0_9CHLR|nr:DUF4386 domain-containing protein [Dehalogenimonas formicexedens]APV43618.1 hypothetical protein Dform_00255 [Dehalogenimonas formicexedens]
MNSINATARLAGVFYLVYIVASIIANAFGNFVFADASATINQIMAHESSFRIGLVTSLFSFVFFLLAAGALYSLLKPVNKNLALLFLLLNLGGFAISCVSTLGLFASMTVLNGADYSGAFQPDQIRAQATLLINLYHAGSVIANIPFAVWLLPLGYLVFKSGFLPKALGVLLIMDFFTLSISVVQHFLLPDYKALAYPSWIVGFIAEFGLAIWLLFKGTGHYAPASVQEAS